jgi:hypothetical protein
MACSALRDAAPLDHRGSQGAGRAAAAFAARRRAFDEALVQAEIAVVADRDNAAGTGAVLVGIYPCPGQVTEGQAHGAAGNGQKPIRPCSGRRDRVVSQ